MYVYLCVHIYNKTMHMQSKTCENKFKNKYMCGMSLQKAAHVPSLLQVPLPHPHQTFYIKTTQTFFKTPSSP